MNWINDEKKKSGECPDCFYTYHPTPIRSLPSCPHCGLEFGKKGENWDQTDPRYTDEALKRFAVDATNYLLKEEYQKRRWDMYSINWKSTEWGETSNNYLFDDCWTICVGACNVNINYNMKALRSKKHCGDTVAHESAHASPRVIVGEVEKKYIYPQKEKNGQRYYLQKSNDYWTGHHSLWQREHHNFRNKLRKQFPQYWGE